MNTDYKCVTTMDGINDYIGGSRIVAFDFETAPDDPYREEDKAALDPARAHIVGCSFSVKEGTGIYVPIAHRIGTNIDKDAFFAFLTAFLINTTTIKIAHNIAFESSMAYARGIVIQTPVYDTICASQMSIRSPLVMNCAIPHPSALTCLATSSVWTIPLRHFPHSWKPAGSSWKMCGYRWKMPRQKSQSPSPERKSCKARPPVWTS